MAGCGGGDGGGASGGAGAGGGAAIENPVDAATAGNIAGSIVFEGDAPSMDAIDMASESVCAAKHASTPMAQEVVVNGNGTLANVFVYVKEGLESLQFPTPGPALLDQDGCTYIPHVLGVMAGQGHHDSEQRRPSAQHQRIAHRTARIQHQPAGLNMETTRSFGTAEVMVPLRCDVHGWMNAYIGVLAHPYHSVSDG